MGPKPPRPANARTSRACEAHGRACGAVHILTLVNSEADRFATPRVAAGVLFRDDQDRWFAVHRRRSAAAPPRFLSWRTDPRSGRLMPPPQRPDEAAGP